MKDVIELTDTWACRITLCGNAETLGIDAAGGLTKEEAATLVVEAGQDAVIREMPHCEAGDVDGNFAAWNGGQHARATFLGYGVAAELFHRDPEAVDDDLTYGEWKWASRKDTPRVLADGVQELVDRISAAMALAREALDAEAEAT